MTDNYTSVSHWGYFPDIKCTSNEIQTRFVYGYKSALSATNLQSQFKEGWEASLGLHLLEEVN